MSEPKRLMMEIEIKFGKGRSDRVQVHYGDDAEKLALVHLFCAFTFVFFSNLYLYSFPRILYNDINLKKPQLLLSRSTSQQQWKTF